MDIDTTQLETLKRRLEDDFRLDLAAIERLQQRMGAIQPSASRTAAWPASTAPVAEAPMPPPVGASRADSAPAPDELTSSLRAMFSHAR